MEDDEAMIRREVGLRGEDEFGGDYTKLADLTTRNARWLAVETNAWADRCARLLAVIDRERGGRR